MQELRGMTPEETENLALSAGQRRFRGRQLFRRISRGETDFRKMSDLPEVFIEFLERETVSDSLRPVMSLSSETDGTKKFLYEIRDNQTIETVFMKYKYGNTVCVSSQAGCRMGCAFCASGLNGLKRGLTAGEIVSQVFDAEREAGEPVSRVVVMGTGEPFDNYEEVTKALSLLHDSAGRNMSFRNMTVSTSGIIPGIKRFSEEFPQVNLAVSLHASHDRQRSEIMPVNRKYSLKELIPACREAAERTGRRITFEYALIKGLNDGKDDAERLIRLLGGMLCHVNIIPLNEVGGTGFASSGRKRAVLFRDYLTAGGIPATVRRTLGADIQGACGELRSKSLKKEVSAFNDRPHSV